MEKVLQEKCKNTENSYKQFMDDAQKDVNQTEMMVEKLKAELRQ